MEKQQIAVKRLEESRETASVKPLAMDVLRQFRLIFGSMRQHFRDVEEQCGISGSQLWLLTEAKRHPGAGVSELAKRLGIHQSTASILVEKLCARDLLFRQRDSNDLRRIGLHLSAASKVLLAHVPGPAEGLLPRALEALPEEVLQTLNIHLNELIEKLHWREDRYSATLLADIVSGACEEKAKKR